jgi:hypothetical protein
VRAPGGDRVDRDRGPRQAAGDDVIGRKRVVKCRDSRDVWRRSSASR